MDAEHEHSADEGVVDEFEDDAQLDEDLVDVHFSSLSAQTTEEGSQKSSPRSKQRRFVSNRLETLKDLGPHSFAEVMIQPILQYFVSHLCDLKVPEENRQRVGLRYARTPEVQRLIRRLRKAKTSRTEIASADPNVIIAVLRQLLVDFPGGIFDDRDEEFLCVSLHTRLDLALHFVSGLVQELPVFLRQFTFLVCKSLKNLAHQSAGGLIDSYTDLLMLFAPVLFPNSVGDVSRFLRATRITLIMIDLSDEVFRPLLEQSALTDSAYHSDEDFFADVLNTLNQLSDSFHVPNQTEERDGAEDDEFWLDSSELNSSASSSSNNNEYYQITYM